MLAKEPSTDQCADVIAINQLAHSYAQAISRGQDDEAAQTYCPDGTLTTPVLAPVTGRAAIKAAIREGTKDLEMVFHVVQNSVVEVRGDLADACFQVTEWAKRKSDGTVFLYLGFYDDQLVRLPEGWRFLKRTLVSAFLRVLTSTSRRFTPSRACAHRLVSAHRTGYVTSGKRHV